MASRTSPTAYLCPSHRSKAYFQHEKEMAIQQMDSRKYGKDLEGFRTVIFYGASFYEKDVTIKAK